MELCSIFANTLDNAIEASLKIEFPSPRKISLKARCANGFFSYSITNLKINTIVITDKIITNKSDKQVHGLGLENITDIVKKYDGTIDISYTENKFSVVIIIPLQ